MKSSVLSVSCVFILLAACGTAETTVPDDADTDGSGFDVVSDIGGSDGGVCVDGAERMEDCNTCTCLDGAWACTRMACLDAGPDADPDISPDTRPDDVANDVLPDAACVDGAERMEDCNRCECLDGGWSCTEIACADVGTDAGEDVEADTGTDAVADADSMDADAVADADSMDADPVDADTVDSCLAACGLGCPAPSFQPCGTDGERYCSECVMACEDVGLADTTFECEAPCELPETGTEPTWTEWTPPEACPLAFPEPFGEGGFFLEVTDETAFESARICPEGVASEIDWNTQRLVRAVVSDNPSGSLAGVRQDGGAITVYLTAPVYCGGAPPPSSTFYVLVPAGEESVDQDVCIRGACQGPPRP